MQNRLTPEACKAARTTASLSQARVATDLGINRTYLSQFESGKYRLDEPILDKLSNYFIEKTISLAQETTEAQNFVGNVEVTTENTEDIHRELDELRSSIASLCAYDLDNSRFLGLWIDEEEAEERTEEVILLMARAYLLGEEMKGNVAIKFRTETIPAEKTKVIRYVRDRLTASS